MKSILVPTDFSECSTSAYSYASLLAEKTHAVVYLLHVLDVPFPSQSVNGNDASTRLDTHFMMELMKLTKVRMKKAIGSKTFKNVEVKEVIEIGSMPERVFAAAKKYKADIIVMGTHGAKGFQEKFIGTNAEKVVRNAEIPVLSVKEAVVNPKIETIILATDFSSETEHVLPAVSKIAGILSARLILTKVVTQGTFETTFETARKIQKFRNSEELYNFSTKVYYAHSKEEGIRRASSAVGASMIALGTHGRHGLSHLFNGSIAEEVVSHASLPVLTINFHKKLLNSKVKTENKKLHRYDSDFLYQIPSV